MSKKSMFFRKLGGGGGATDFTTNLVAAYQGENNTDDYTGNHNGTINGTVTYTTGKVGNCFDFQGTNDYITAPNSTDFSIGDGFTDNAFSVAFWVYLDTYTTAVGFVNKGAGSQSEWTVYLTAGGDLLWLIYNTSSPLSNFIRATHSLSPSTTTWYHIVCTYDGGGSETGLTIYINGSDVSATQSQTGTYTVSSNKVTQDFLFGERSGTAFDLDGRIDELKVWNGRELTSSEVLEMYNTENAGTSVLP